jgi:hypothetical protein
VTLDRYAQQGVYWTHAGRHFGLEMAPEWKRAEKEQAKEALLLKDQEAADEAVEAFQEVGLGRSSDTSGRAMCTHLVIKLNRSWP